MEHKYAIKKTTNVRKVLCCINYVAQWQFRLF
jgi:hypothetical protein